MYICSRKKGLVVQLVRIHACHAWGRGFESRPDRELNLKPFQNERVFFIFKMQNNLKSLPFFN